MHAAALLPILQARCCSCTKVTTASPLQKPMPGVAMPGVVQPVGQGRHAMASLSLTSLYEARYRPVGQSRTTLSSQKRPGGTWQTWFLSARVPL